MLVADAMRGFCYMYSETEVIEIARSDDNDIRMMIVMMKRTTKVQEVKKAREERKRRRWEKASPDEAMTGVDFKYNQLILVFMT